MAKKTVKPVTEMTIEELRAGKWGANLDLMGTNRASRVDGKPVSAAAPKIGKDK